MGNVRDRAQCRDRLAQLTNQSENTASPSTIPSLPPIITSTAGSSDVTRTTCVVPASITTMPNGQPIEYKPKLALAEVYDKTGQYEQDGLSRPLTQGVTDMLFSAFYGGMAEASVTMALTVIATVDSAVSSFSHRPSPALLSTQLHPVVPPHVSHLRHVPFRTSVKLAHSGHDSPS